MHQTETYIIFFIGKKEVLFEEACTIHIHNNIPALYLEITAILVKSVINHSFCSFHATFLHKL